MATLKQFLGLSSTVEIRNLFVYNTNQSDHLDGGRCCCYVVPSGITQAYVELWGGGGSGSGSCCCQWTYAGATPGQYVLERFAVSSGQALTICAGGSGCCSTTCCGFAGFPSFVSRSGTILACAPGGIGGCQLCFYKGFNCTGVCVPANRMDMGFCGDLSQCVFQGFSPTHNFCASDLFEAAAGSPKYSQNARVGGAFCAYEFTKMGCCYNANHWPAGPGAGGSACGGGCCWGGWGAGGLVVLTFYG